MQLKVYLVTSKGIIECILSRKDWYGAQVIYADMSQSIEVDGKIGFTVFRACVHLQWDGNRYTIIEAKYRTCTDFWRELETSISNTIVVNE
jgi:hypothetical protein